MRAFEKVSSRDKHVFTHRGPKWATFYADDARAAQLAFFERHLAGANVPALPPVRLEVRESRHVVAEVRTEQEWPLARTEWRSLYLSTDGRLTDAHAPDGSVTFSLRRAAASFTLDFTEDTEITGPMSVRLWASIAGPTDASLFAGVEKWSGDRYVPFEGSYGYGRDRIAQGKQRLSLRRLDATLSTPHQPEHAFREPEPVGAGPVEVQIPLSSSSTIFRAGDSLRLLIGGRYLEPRNPLFGNLPAQYRSSAPGRCTLHWAAGRPAALEVPVIAT